MAPKRKASDYDILPPATRRTPKGNRFTPGANPQLPWHGGDFLLSRFRIKDLLKEGFLKYPVDQMPPIDPDFQVPPSRAAELIPGGSLYEHIHPVFERSRWLDVSDDDYDLLAPSIRLASCFLNEPAMMPYWKGLFHTPWSLLNDPALVNKVGVPLHQFHRRNHHPDDVQGRTETRAVWMKLQKMSRHVRWSFSPDLITKFATTRHLMSSTTNQPLDGFVPNLTKASSIVISMEFLEVLRGNIRASSFPKVGHLGDAEAQVRTIWLLAFVMVHEVNHAISMAIHEVHDWSKFREPFYEDLRVNELGRAWEVFLVGGTVRVTGTNSIFSNGRAMGSASCPYGLALCRWPGPLPAASCGGPLTLERASHGFHGERYFYEWAIPFQHMHQFFTKQFWERDVLMLQQAAFPPKLWLGVGRLARTHPLHAEEVGKPPRPVFYPQPPMVYRAWLERVKGFRIKDDLEGDSVVTDEGAPGSVGAVDPALG